jgi:alpha-beta hydrolase superfamily lysophospholipase
MTVTDQHARASEWDEPEGLNPRGTLIVVPGRGEPPEVYERFGRRLASDSYRVRAVTDPTADLAAAWDQATAYLADPGLPGPRVLAGSDTGALFAIRLAVLKQAGPDALILAGLPGAAPAAAPARSWDEELDARTACPVHRARLTSSGLRRGALQEAVPADWAEQADLSAVGIPVLGLHGREDVVSPLASVRAWYAAAPAAELVGFEGGRHDVLNDQLHRTVAATVVLFLERLRLGRGVPPIAIPEPLARG